MASETMGTLIGRLRATLIDWNRENDDRQEHDPPPDGGWVVEAAEALVSALDQVVLSGTVVVPRVGAVREFCLSQIEHDRDLSRPDVLTDRAWCAQSVLNILDGNIDDQLAQSARSKPLQFIGYDPGTVERLEADAARLHRVTAVDDSADRVVSKYQPLVERTEAFAQRADGFIDQSDSDGVSGVIGVNTFAELATLVRDLARAVAER